MIQMHEIVTNSQISNKFPELVFWYFTLKAWYLKYYSDGNSWVLMRETLYQLCGLLNHLDKTNFQPSLVYVYIWKKVSVYVKSISIIWS